MSIHKSTNQQRTNMCMYAVQVNNLLTFSQKRDRCQTLPGSGFPQGLRQSKQTWQLLAEREGSKWGISNESKAGSNVGLLFLAVVYRKKGRETSKGDKFDVTLEEKRGTERGFFSPPQQITERKSQNVFNRLHKPESWGENLRPKKRNECVDVLVFVCIYSRLPSLGK